MTEPGPSESPKAPTHIAGFDDISHGGLPRGRTTLVFGVPGSGKTVFALQTLVNAARRGEPGIFVAFEEQSKHLLSNAADFGWNLPELIKKKLLYFLDAHMTPSEVMCGSFDLAGTLAIVHAKAVEMGASMIVFDAVDVLLTLLNDFTRERQELYRMRDWIYGNNKTGIITSRAEDPREPSSLHYSFLQYMSDMVIVLYNDIVERVAFRGIRILKYRGSDYEENFFPLVIADSGMEISGLAIDHDLGAAVSKDRLASGIERLDRMMRGGYIRGWNVLITGAPGTAKSTLCGSFAEACCKRGERTAYISFDELPSEMVRNFKSVNINLDAHIKSGCLVLKGMCSEARSAEEHLMAMKNILDRHKPMNFIIDQLSAIQKNYPIMGISAAARLLYYTKSLGITCLFSSLTRGDDPNEEATPLQVSTLADAWIHLSYMIQGGERNRALTIVKARGTGHSNQVRELIMSDEGVTLRDVFSTGGQVLMGTLRWEKEKQIEIERDRIRAEMKRRERQYQVAESELRGRIETLQVELAARHSELEILRIEQKAIENNWKAEREGIKKMRRADDEQPQKD